MQIDNNNKPSAQEQARADDKKRQSHTQKNLGLQNKIAAQAGRQSNLKETKSSFDNVLENLVQDSLTQTPESASSAFESKFKEKVQEKEKPKEKVENHKEKEKDSNKTEKSEGNEQNKNVKDLGVRQQINAKSKSGEGGSGNNSQEQSGQQKGQGSAKQFGAELLKSNTANLIVPTAQAPSSFDVGIQIEKAKSSAATPQIPKQLLDQMIQVIKIGMSKADEKEIHLDLSEKIFKGLSLKLTSQNGKIDVKFITTNSHVKRLFENEKQNIASALQDKGVSVSQISVQYAG